MEIQLVSFPSCRLTKKERKYRIESISGILKETKADFVMFSEHVLKSKEDLYTISDIVGQKQVTALFELNESYGIKGNRLYLLRNGKISDLQTHQTFFDSAGATEHHIELLIDEMEQHRQFEVGGINFLIIQCGENNILKGNTGSAEFRLQNRIDLKKRLTKLLNDADIVLNPVHSRWGRFGTFLCRIRKFSENKRYCFSCTQISDNQLFSARKDPGHNSTHIVMHSKRRIAPIYTNEIENYLLQTYEIESD